MNWYEAKGQLTFEQEKDRKLDYFKTFYGSISARRVFADIRSHALEIEVATPDSAIQKLALLDLIESIKESCGVSDQGAIVDAEMQTAVHFIETKKPEKVDLLKTK